REGSCGSGAEPEGRQEGNEATHCEEARESGEETVGQARLNARGAREELTGVIRSPNATMTNKRCARGARTGMLVPPAEPLPTVSTVKAGSSPGMIGTLPCPCRRSFAS